MLHFLLCILQAINSNVVLIKDNKHFSSLISSDNVLVKFYAPWCGHCKALAPEYIEAAKHLKDNKFEALLAEVDCTEKKTKEICEKYEVRGYPTMKYFSAGKKDPIDYSGARKKDGLIAYIRNMLTDAITLVTSKDQLEDLIKKNKFLVVEYAKKGNSDRFTQMADELRLKFAFASISDESLLSEHGSKFDDVHIFRSFDEKKVEFDHDGKMKLSEWIHYHSIPVMGELNGDNYADYKDLNKNMFWFAVDKNDKKTMDSLEGLTDVLKQHKENVLAFYIDGVHFAHALKSMGFSDSLPSVMLIDTKDKKYKFDQEISAENVKNFLKLFEEKKLEQHIKSEEAPEKNDGSIIEVVGKTFKKIVMDEENDVVIEFYLTQCGHCKKLAPEYEKVGNTYQGNKFLKIAKINGGENDFPVEVSGYPTIMLFRAGKKSDPLTYDGGRTASEIESWIYKNSPLYKKSLEKITGGEKEEL